MWRALAARIPVMNIRIDTQYTNCSLFLDNIQIDDSSYICDIKFNSGWLSCVRSFTFSREGAISFEKSVRKISEPFDTVANLESTNKESCISFECIDHGAIKIFGVFSEDSEFGQQAKLGFNIETHQFREFIESISTLIKSANKLA